MTEEEKQQLNSALDRINQLEQTNDKNNFSDLVVFEKKVQFKSTVSGVTNLVNFTEAYSPSAGYSAGGSSAFEDWDISAIVPAGTKAVEVSMTNKTGSAINMGVRKNGSALNRYPAVPGNISSVVMICEVGSDLIIEVFTGDHTNSNFVITGYWS